METVKFKVEVITCQTLLGKRKKYKLPDMSYGQWLILENGYPKYYFDIFDPIYDSFRDTVGKHTPIEAFLEAQFKKHQKPLYVRQYIRGICEYTKSTFEPVELEKLPPELLF